MTCDAEDNGEGNKCSCPYFSGLNSHVCMGNSEWLQSCTNNAAYGLMYDANGKNHHEAGYDASTGTSRGSKYQQATEEYYHRTPTH